MKIERAIKLLDNSIGYEYSPEYDKALEMAIQALNKRIPMKADPHGEVDYICDSCYCYVGYLFDYCSSCGQALDWGV